MRNLLGADSSYLLVSQFDRNAVQFSKGLGVQLLNLKRLAVWEASLKIPADKWPCRADYQVFDSAREHWNKLSRGKEVDEDWQLFREALTFIEVDSWLSPQYRLLNRLFRYIGAISTSTSKYQQDEDKRLCCMYILSALLIRLAQYLLTVCLDVSSVDSTDLGSYMHERLTFGDHDPAHISSLIEGTVEWIRTALREKGTPLPAEIDVGRLYSPPHYANEFIELVQRMLNSPNEARFLPITLEVSQFGDSSPLDEFPRLKSAAAAGDSLGALLRGFIIRTFSVPTALLEPVSSELRRKYTLSARRKSAPQQEPGQLRFSP